MECFSACNSPYDLTMRELSSTRTIIYKCILPGVMLLLGCAILTICVLWILNEPLLLQYLPHMNKPSDKFPQWLSWFLGVTCILASIFGMRQHKRVSLDGSTLVVSNYLTDIHVPVADIGTVKQIIAAKDPNYITVEFTHDTPFGRQITFLPPWKPPARWFKAPQYPVVAELQQLVTADKQSKEPSTGQE